MSTRQPYFELGRSRIQGRGAMALRKIRAGTRIIEYTGERISHAEADARYDDEAMGRHHTFLFSVDRKTTIDAAVGGNGARFINHSCEPSCEAANVGGRIFIFAKRTIQPGEELTYDYAYRLDADDLDEETMARYACRCGAPSCRGTILDLERVRRKRTAKVARTKHDSGRPPVGVAERAACAPQVPSAPRIGRIRPSLMKGLIPTM